MNNSSLGTSSHMEYAVAGMVHCPPNQASANRGVSALKTLAQHGKTPTHVTISRSDMREGLRFLGKCTGDSGSIASLEIRLRSRHIHNKL